MIGKCVKKSCFKEYFCTFVEVFFVMQLDFEIDKLTRSLEDVQTGESYTTEVLPLSKYDW